MSAVILWRWKVEGVRMCTKGPEVSVSQHVVDRESPQPHALYGLLVCSCALQGEVGTV